MSENKYVVCVKIHKRLCEKIASEIIVPCAK